MKAITIQQPWAALIAEGIKDVENRHQRWGHRGRIAIHVSQKIDWDGGNDPRVQEAARTAQRGSLLHHQGHIIAVATLADCHAADAALCNCGRWANPGAKFHLKLNGVVKLRTPVFSRGRLGPWDLSPVVEAAVVRQLAGSEVSE